MACFEIIIARFALAIISVANLVRVIRVMEVLDARVVQSKQFAQKRD